MFRVSGFEFRVSGFWFQVVWGFRCRLTATRNLKLETRNASCSPPCSPGLRGETMLSVKQRPAAAGRYGYNHSNYLPYTSEPAF